MRINAYYNISMIKLLKQNGFVEIRQAGSHKILRNNKTNKTVTVPFHAKDLPKGTERNILKQAGLK